MLDLEKQEPKIELCNPFLTYYGPNTAILYAYLKYYIEENAIELIPHENYPYYEIIANRFETKKATGLSNGQQVDAELDLCGAFLVDSTQPSFDKVEYHIYLCNEDMARRDVYEKQGKWKFFAQQKA